MRKNRSMFAAIVAVLALLASACTTGSDTGDDSGGGARHVTGTNANTVNTGKTKAGGTVTYAIERNIANWNPLGDDTLVETQYIADVFDPSTFAAQPDLKTIAMNSDLLTSATETSSSPETIVYKINPKAVWSTGAPITVDDFKYTWATSDPRQCAKCATTSTVGYDQIKSINGSDSGRTVTVVFNSPFGDWRSLFSPILPVSVAKTLGDDGTTAGLAKSFNDGFRYASGFPNWSGGPYLITSWQNNQAATLVPNPKWWGAKPPLKKLIFRIITDTTQEVPALSNGEIQVINPQPQVDLLRNVKALDGFDYQVGAGLQTQSMGTNLQHPVMQNAALRRALFTALDVKQMVAKTVAQFDPSITPLRSRFFVPQQMPYYQNNLGDLGTGNITAAKSMLTSAGYTTRSGKLADPKGKTVPALVLRYTQNNAIQQTECEIFAADAKKIGVTVLPQTTDNLGQTLTHQAGKDYDIVANAFFATPYVASNSAQLYMTKAGLNFGGYSNAKVDALYKQALATTDRTRVAATMNSIDKLISSDAYEMPLYQMPSLVAYKRGIVNIRVNASYFGTAYNAGQWGYRA